MLIKAIWYVASIITIIQVVLLIAICTPILDNIWPNWFSDHPEHRGGFPDNNDIDRLLLAIGYLIWILTPVPFFSWYKQRRTACFYLSHLLVLFLLYLICCVATVTITSHTSRTLTGSILLYLSLMLWTVQLLTMTVYLCVISRERRQEGEAPVTNV